MFWLALSGALCSLRPAPVVNLTAGNVEGNAHETHNEFLGIPFGYAPRFQPPVDRVAEPFTTDPLPAKVFGPACIQAGDFDNETYGSETECLVMNVWQPFPPPKEPLAVMLFVPGGSWQFGEAQPYNMSKLAEHQVVAVSLNYRLGPFGFIAFDEMKKAGNPRGNFGMMDIASGLRWVQREISKFGGDPARVTLMGQSSAGQGAEVAMVMPMMKGLFRGVISESTGMGASSVEYAEEQTKLLASQLKCDNATLHPKGVLDCMSKKPAVKILAAVDNSGFDAQMGPYVDGEMIPFDPEVMRGKGLVNNVSFLAGAQTNDSNRFCVFNYGEGGGYKHVNASAYRSDTNDTLYEYFGADPAGARLAEALSLYPPIVGADDDDDEGAFANVTSNIFNECTQSSDRLLCGRRKDVAEATAATGSPAFLYRFNHRYESNPNCTFRDGFHDPALGVTHEDEVNFFFGQPIFMFDGSTCNASYCMHCAFDAVEAKFAWQVGRYLTNFASNTDPNDDTRGTQKLEQKLGADALAWPQYTKWLDSNIVMQPMPDGSPGFIEKAIGRDRKCNFWRDGK